jgi:DNA-directed RNA polymerase II subunit RPB1
MAAHGEIESVEFSLASDADRRRAGVVEVRSHELFTSQLPVAGGVYDPQMGTTDNHYTCSTCEHNKKLCPGHFGTLTLKSPAPLPLPGSPVPASEVRRWLKIVCLRCGALLVDVQKYASAPRGRRLMKAAEAETAGRSCPRCRAKHPKIVKTPQDHFSFRIEGAGGGRRLTYGEIRSIFERVSESDVEALGRPLTSHPSRLVVSVVAVPPITIRPGVKIGVSDKRSHHDLNNLLQYLVRHNQSLPEEPPQRGSEGWPDHERQLEALDQLYYDLVLGSAATGAGTAGSGGRRSLVTSSGRPSPAVLRRLPRKEGRIRRNLMGKRTWNACRSTIAGNNSLRLDEVGLPVAFARVMQISETVQAYNLERLSRFFLNGRRRYPGATRVRKKATGAVHDVEGLRPDFLLEPGDVLYRDVVTGDMCYYNRTPSLERSSIGAHRVVVLEDPQVATLQMNVAACAWYNADFDGDQMLLWVPHGAASRAEAALVSAVANLFVSTKNSGPVNGEIQDSVIGSFLLTRDAARLDRHHAMAVFQKTRLPPPALPPGTYSGREVVSALFESHFPVNYSRVSSWYDEVFRGYVNYSGSERRAEMRRGRLAEGVLDKRAVGDGARGGLFHLVSRGYTPQRALDAIFALQQLAVGYAENAGFTVSANDMLLPRPERERVGRVLAERLWAAEEVNRRLVKGELVPPLGMTTHQFYEKLQIETLKLPDRVLEPILSAIDSETNGLFRMVATGSKGKKPNIINIMAAVGPIEINTQRIQPRFAHGRTLVYYPRHSLAPAAYGFVGNSYMSGLSSPEYVFAAMNGRFDLINKALSTASTGYLNRRMVLALQTGIVDNLRRLTNGQKVFQMLYGEDGLDARQVEEVPFHFVKLGDAELRRRFLFDAERAAQKKTARGSPGRDDAALYEAELARLREGRDTYRAAFLRLEASGFSHPFPFRRLLPVRVGVLLEDLRLQLDAKRAPPSFAELRAMRLRVDQFCSQLPYVYANESMRRREAFLPPYLKTAAALTALHVRAALCTVALAEAKIAPPQLDQLLDQIRLRYARSLVAYGEAAGVLAAQAVAEPLTQYMLDSHHRSVSGGTNKSGIARPQEILGAKGLDKEQSSEMLLPLLPEEDRTAAAAEAAARELATAAELVTLGHFALRWQLLLEPLPSAEGPRSALYPDDGAWVDQFRRDHPLLEPPPDLTAWCVRFELDRATLVLKSLGLEQVVTRLRALFPRTYVVHTPESAKSLALRVQLRAGLFRRGDEERAAVAFAEKLAAAPLRGVAGVRTAKAEKITRHREAADGELVEESRWAVRTVGTNLGGALSLVGLDPAEAVSSSLEDTLRCLGIEAARARIAGELQRVLGDGPPNPRHPYLIADAMTRAGRLVSLEAAGIVQRDRSNVLLQMAAAKPIQVLSEAALEGAKAPIQGLSAPLMMGSIPRVGTFHSETVIDEAYVAENVRSLDRVFDEL